MSKSGVFFPAEWYPQSGVQICWPHLETDWSDILDEVIECYISFSKEILKQEKLVVVCREASEVEMCFSAKERENLTCIEIDSNDTWARDHAAISVFIDNKPVVLDFGFNGWGLKFAANKDNLITEKLYKLNVYQPKVSYLDYRNFILEGGSVESDGKGTLLTTSKCLLAPNRNQPMNKMDIDGFLKESLGADRVLWLSYGYLEGDDTDSHVDTLARFCNENTIAYVKCDDINDIHYPELKMMEQELKSFLTKDGQPYNLIALPMTDAMYGDGGRMPSTYANFLILNNSVLLPTYGSVKDDLAIDLLQEAFPEREVVGIDCRALVKQYGSLHCVTMQYPEGFF